MIGTLVKNLTPVSSVQLYASTMMRKPAIIHHMCPYISGIFKDKYHWGEKKDGGMLKNGEFYQKLESFSQTNGICYRNLPHCITATVSELYVSKLLYKLDIKFIEFIIIRSEYVT